MSHMVKKENMNTQKNVLASAIWDTSNGLKWLEIKQQFVNKKKKHIYQCPCPQLLWRWMFHGFFARKKWIFQCGKFFRINVVDWKFFPAWSMFHQWYGGTVILWLKKQLQTGNYIKITRCQFLSFHQVCDFCMIFQSKILCLNMHKFKLEYLHLLPHQSQLQSSCWMENSPSDRRWGACSSHHFQYECNSRCCYWQSQSPVVAVHRFLPGCRCVVKTLWQDFGASNISMYVYSFLDLQAAKANRFRFTKTMSQESWVLQFEHSVLLFHDQVYVSFWTRTVFAQQEEQLTALLNSRLPMFHSRMETGEKQQHDAAKSVMISWCCNTSISIIIFH